MLYFFWALLNIGLFIWFTIICFKATKLVHEKSGSAAALLFVFGLLSFAEHSNSDNDNLEPDSNQIKTWKFNLADSLDNAATAFIDIELEKTLISTYSLSILYGNDKQLKNNIPVSASSSVTGFTAGTSWKPTSIIVNSTNDNQQFSFVVDGIVKWKLLGFTVYAQRKNWKGVAVLK